MTKTLTCLSFSVLAAVSLQAGVLLMDSTNYPYTNGCIEGQGQWYCYSPKTPNQNAFVTNNVLLLTANSANDSVATPTNGWVNPTFYTYASFIINVSQLPSSPNGGYFCQFQDNNDTNDCCHVFIDTLGTTVPGTYRLGIGNFATSFTGLTTPNNYTVDLATNTPYTVVILFDSSRDQFDPLVGATLWVNPSEQDFENDVNDVFGTDTTGSQSLLNMKIQQIGFSPYINAGVSNLIVSTNFDDVNTTNLPVTGVQPLSGTNYSGNTAVFYTAVSGVDLTYQWYSQSSGMLHDDGVNIIGSSSNVLVINNLSVSDIYHLVATDAYGNSVTSSNAVETVITTQTPPFFPASTVPVNLTNNLFTYSGFTNIAYGTGPLYYQWFFAPSNTPASFSPLPGQTGPGLSLDLVDYTYAGNYFVIVSNAVNGGSVAVGPTNSLTEIAPLIATMLQLHNFLIATTNQLAAKLTSSYYLNTNNVIVSGYVSDYGGSSGTTSFGGYGTSYSEFFMQDASGYGVEVFINGLGNTNGPPVGTYITVSAPLEVYHAGLEMVPAALAAITASNAPPLPVTPRLFNYAFSDVITNWLGTNATLADCSLVTLTNVYIYGSASGGALGSNGSHSGVGGIFASNTYNILYCTIGQYSATPPINTNVWEVFQPAYNYGPAAAIVATNSCDNQVIPTYCYQLTGIYLNYGGAPEIIPSRLADYVSTPPSFSTTLTITNVTANKKTSQNASVSWPVLKGSTYTVSSATNLSGPWTPSAYGLNYYPVKGTFTDTNPGTAKFYRVTSP